MQRSWVYGFLNNIPSYTWFRIDDSWKGPSSKRRRRETEAVKRLLLGSVSRSALDLSSSVCEHCLCLKIVFVSRRKATRFFFFITRISSQTRSVKYFVCVPRQPIMMESSWKNKTYKSGVLFRYAILTNNEVSHKYSFNCSRDGSYRMESVQQINNKKNDKI